MKKKNWVKRILSICLTAAFLFGTLPISLAQQEETSPVSAIVREDVRLREESVKQFICEDGSYLLVAYGSPVHYRENGVWKEIDNSLELSGRTLSASGRATYMPKAGGLPISLPQDFTNGQQVEVSNKGYTFGFGIHTDTQVSSLRSAATLVDAEELLSAIDSRQEELQSQGGLSQAEQIQEQNAEKMTLNKLTSAVTYNGVFPDADLEYIITPDGIKENIVVTAPQEEYIYRFDVSMEGLAAVPQEDGSILLVEETDPGEAVFSLPAPYMYDANGETSGGVQMTLKNGILTVTANSTWVNDEGRAFPVVIDPTINTNSQSVIQDAYVTSLLPNSTNTNLLRLYAGKTALGERNRTYIKFNLPSIPSGAKVTYAQFELMKLSVSANSDLKVYNLMHPSFSTLNTSSVTWNNQPMSTTANNTTNLILVDSVGTPSGSVVYRFNVTSAIHGWYAGDRNNGLVITTPNENTTGQVTLYSTGAATTSYRPVLWFNYDLPSVSASSWNTDDQAATSPAFSVTCGTGWTATPTQPWLSVTDISSSTFKLSAAANLDTSERTDTVTVRAAGGTVIGTIAVTQAGAEPILPPEEPNEPTPEEAMVYEAAAIGQAHYASAMNDTTFKYDPNTNYSTLLEDDSFQRRFTEFVLPYDLSNLQNLSDMLTTAGYSTADAELFVDRWAVAFARMPLEDIRQTVLCAGADVDVEAVFVPLTGQAPLADAEGMLTAVFDYYHENIFANFFDIFSNELAQDAFGMTYAEAMGLYYNTQPWTDFDETMSEYGLLISFSYEWVVASYLKNLAAMNDIFDEIGMVREAMGIGVFETVVSSLNASFHYDPSKTYGGFGLAMSDLTGIGTEFIAAILDCDVGNATALRTALMDAGYSGCTGNRFH